MEKNRMKKLLFVNACVRGEASRTLELSRFYIDGFLEEEKAAGRNWDVEEVCLDEIEGLKPLDSSELALRDSMLAAGDFSHSMFDHAKKIISADHVVIGAPYWDLQFPAKLKVYLEACCVCGLSFYYSPEGIPQGQCRADKIVYITTSGGAIGKLNFGYDYVKGLFGNLLGVRESEFISAEELDIFGKDVEAILRNAEDKITEQVENF